MVTKKYLCPAPRPETWEDRAQALLKSFQGDVEKRDAMLRQTLQQLKSARNYERRTGPGRKSHAEHAIAFYEYVLGENDDSDGSSSSSSDSGENNDDDEEGAGNKEEPEGEEEEKTIESMDSQEFLNQHNDECDVCNLGGELLCCSTCTLVFHLDCVRPRLEELPDGDWSCAYCVLGGNAGDYKKHSKVWKAAAAAVRHMGRLRNTKQREDDSEGDDDGDSKDDTQKDDKEDSSPKKETASKAPDEDEEPGSATETEKHSNSITNEDEPKRRKNLALYKISDALSPAFKVDPSEPTGRGRRPRRQPILYDPQVGPDSRWKTDDPFVKTKEDSDGDDSSSDDDQAKDKTSPSRRRRSAEKEGEETKEASSRDTKPETLGEKVDLASEEKKYPSPVAASKRNAEDKSDKPEDKQSIWCSFCRDDPNIPVCVFCACRICFGKHEKEKILLCDQCDEEYHTFCLKPPLASVPISKNWFCPSCKAAASTELKVSTRRLSSSPTRSGTPTSTRSTSTKKERPSTPKSTPGSSSKGTPKTPPKSTPKAVIKTSTGRPRGRPPKNKSPQPPPTDPTPTPRKRGRPPKNKQVLVASSPTEVATPTPRKRGRPPKNPPSNNVTPAPTRKKPGPKPGSSNKRSISPVTRKAEASSSTSKKARTDSGNSSSEQASQTPPEQPLKISRSGRVVKRSSFHDEMEEGEQHLRTTRKSDTDGGSRTDNLSDASQSGTEEEASRGDINSAGDATMGTEEDMAGHEEASVMEHTGHGIDDDELSEDTGDGLPVRTKVIEPPGISAAKQEPLHPPAPVLPVVDVMEVDEPEPTEPEAALAAPETEVASEPPAPADESPATTGTIEETKSEPHPSSDIKHVEPAVTDVAPEMVVMDDSTAKVSSKDASAAIVEPAKASAAASAPKAVKKVARSATAPKAGTEPNLQVDVHALVKAAIANIPTETEEEKPNSGPIKVPRRKPGARECMQISRRFGVRVIPKKFMDTLLDYCTRGKVEHLIRMRERLDEHSRFLESQLAGLEALVREKGESDVVVPPLPERAQAEIPTTGSTSINGKPFNMASSGSASSSPVPSFTRPAVSDSVAGNTNVQSKVKPIPTKATPSTALAAVGPHATNAAAANTPAALPKPVAEQESHAAVPAAPIGTP